MKFDVVIIGGGLAGMTAATKLQEAGLKCAVVAKGLSLHNISRKPFVQKGGMMFAGDTAVRGEFSGDRLVRIWTEKLGSMALEADSFVLASGKFFAGGLVADMDKVYEPLFGLDVQYNEERSTWFSSSFADHQGFLEFGVKTDDAHAVKDGKSIANLFPAGEILAGISGSEGDAEDAIVESAVKVSQKIIG